MSALGWLELRAVRPTDDDVVVIGPAPAENGPETERGEREGDDLQGATPRTRRRAARRS